MNSDNVAERPIINEVIDRKNQFKNIIRAKQSWINHKNHFESAIFDPWYKSVTKIHSIISVKTSDFFNSRGLLPVLLPVTTGSISSPMGLGSDSMPVKINLGGVDTYLADSMQFLLEYALRLNDKGVYYIMPTFRGEEQDKRHLNQFYHAETEIIGSLPDVIELASSYVTYLCDHFLYSEKTLISQFTNNLNHLEKLSNLKGKIPQLKFQDAVKLLEDNNQYINNTEHGFKKITDEGERKLIELFDGPVWLTHFPSLSVPFYQANSNEAGYSLTADLLMGIGETLGAGERNTYAEDVITNLKDRNVSQDEYDWYIRMRELMPLRTSGFGMGIERFILWLINHDDIRDCQLLPRVHGEDILP
ncbi:asparaginase [Xenorhabdus budapestensis]|uniref:Asparaginase n=1 Tax=Xenorhabdus budapestensis TaxID=290110 RepID=A0ABX7VNM6_XENBU|nr:asparagine synthetase A [Xenorhabdus budapestensis]QTL40383.1 asparaginase [Xenorhabdus budapestensis]